MRRNGFVVLLLVTLFTAPALAATTTQTQPPLTPDEQLAATVKLAHENNGAAAFEMAKKAKASAGEDLFFRVRFIATLADQVTSLKDEKYRIKILNTAIQSANDVEKSHFCDGKGEAEIAFRYMVGLVKLAKELEARKEVIASQLYLSAGRVATNLRTNPGYPANGAAALSVTFIGLAKAYAIRGEQQAAFQAMQTAFELGYNDFESVKNEKFFTKLDQKKFSTSLNSNLKKYQDKTRDWARQAVAAFPAGEFNFNVEGIDSEKVKKSDFQGSVLVVDLWATWCPPCREGIPHFIKLADRLEEQGVAVVGISMDAPTDPFSVIEKVRDFAEDNSINYPIGMGDGSISAQLSSDQKLPTTLFLDRTGKVRYVAEGFHNFHQLEAISNELLQETSHVSSERGFFK